MNTLTKIASKPRKHTRVALAGPAAPPPFAPKLNDAGAAFHGFGELTQEEYEAAQAKETCAECGKTFTYTPETLGKSGKYYCKQDCFDRGNALLIKAKPKGETYNVNGVEYDI